MALTHAVSPLTVDTLTPPSVISFPSVFLKDTGRQEFQAARYNPMVSHEIDLESQGPTFFKKKNNKIKED